MNRSGGPRKRAADYFNDRLSAAVVLMENLRCRCGKSAMYERGRRMFCEGCYGERYTAKAS
jgi:peptidyl-tRNA hydrolase